MIPYWLIFCIPVVAVIAPFRFEKRIRNYLWFLFFLLLTCFIGLRDEVGGDWNGYVGHYNKITPLFNPLEFSFLNKDYGYELVTWITYYFITGGELASGSELVTLASHGGIHIVNLVNALIF